VVTEEEAMEVEVVMEEVIINCMRVKCSLTELFHVSFNLNHR